MKAEERHELKENELAGWMYRLPFFFRDYGSYLLLALAIALFAYQLYNWYQGQKETKRQMAWTEFMDASGQMGAAPADPGRLRALINQYDDMKQLQALAYKALGDYYADSVDYGVLPRGGATMTRDQMEQEALDAYSKVVSDYTDQLLPSGQAHLGLGRVYEDKGQWDKARKEFETVTDKNGPYAGMAIAAEAQRRLDNLGEWSQPVVFGPPAPKAATLPGALGPAPLQLPTLPSLGEPTTIP